MQYYPSLPMIDLHHALHSGQEVLFIDADNIGPRKLDHLLESEVYKNIGVVWDRPWFCASLTPNKATDIQEEKTVKSGDLG